MPRNQRVYFANAAVGIKGDGDASFTSVHGLQSFTKNTTFSLEQAYEWGQLSIYENIEGVPNIECTLTKVLDGYPLVWTLATKQAVSPALTARGITKCLVALSIYPDSNTYAGPAAGGSECEVSGCFPTSVSYSFPVDGFFTESVTIQGSDSVWANDSRMIQSSPWSGATTLNISHGFDGQDAPIGSGGVNRRENFIWDYADGVGLDVNNMVADPDASILPPEVDGISNSGTNELVGGIYNSSIQSVNVTANITRDDIFQLGRRTQALRTIRFPVEVTCEITVIAGSGDMVSATEAGIYTVDGTGQCGGGGNLRDRTIRIATCEGTRIYLGTKNKLSGVNQTGGEAGGGNVSLTYSYSTFNDFVVMHSGEAGYNTTANSESWWANRADYLTDV